MEYPEYRLHHSHINLHLPDDRATYAEFRKQAKAWIPETAQLCFSENKYTKARQFMTRLEDRQRRAKYGLKAMGAHTIQLPDRTTVNLAGFLGMLDTVAAKGDQGVLPVKRVGVSRSIDRSARAIAGYTDTHNPMDWAVILGSDEAEQQVAA